MDYDIIIIGSGPGGYVAAIRAAQLGFKVAVVEKSELGGVCLNWGCIPTKSLLKSAEVLNYAKHAADYGIIVPEAKPDFEKIIQRSRAISAQMNKGVEYLFKKNKIMVIEGFGKVKSAGTVQVTSADSQVSDLSAKHIILATGARSRNLAALPQDGKNIIGYKEALALKEIPESMVIVGSGAIGSEFAYFYNAMGTKVTLVEYLPNIIPQEDIDVSKQLGRSFKKSKIRVMVNSAVTAVEIKDNKCFVSVKTKKGEELIEADIVLSAIGIVPNLENIGIEENNIALENGKIKTDKYYQTNVAGVYAIGDIVQGQALAHVASAEGITCVEAIAGLNPAAIDYGNIPSAIYAQPETASAGLTEKQAIAAGHELRIGKFPFTASGKATAAGKRDGFVKLIFDAKTDEILGAHLTGANVTEMVGELVVAKKLGAKAMDLIKSIHPHPTMSEAIMEAAAEAHNEVIHI